jgi:ribonuclease III
LKPREPLATSDDGESLRHAADGVGHAFANPELLRQALTHSSRPRTGEPCASERLEFLGDAVLNLVISELLFTRHPDWSEGQLSLARAGLVRTASLADKAQALGLSAALLLGRGEEKTGGRHKHSILAAAYESTMGAVFLDAGYERARAVIRQHFAVELEAGRAGETDFKTTLQEHVQARYGSVPTYRLIRTSGPDHARHFVVSVEIDGRKMAEGSGSNKRNAEQQAAAQALEQMMTEAGRS